jgi:hypothetical protein
MASGGMLGVFQVAISFIPRQDIVYLGAEFR